jgi:hypothetical protein
MALREILARFGFQIDDKKIDKADKRIDGFANKLQQFGAIIAGSAIVAGVSSFVKSVQAQGDAIGKTSARLGVGTTELQRWIAAAESAGVSGEEFVVALKSLQKNAANAEAGEKGLAKTFKDLGVELTDSSGKLKDATTLMRETGLALNNLETDTERVAVSQKLMEESGFKLLTLFKGQEKGLNALLATLDEFGGGFGPQAVKASESLGDAFLKWKIASDSVRGALATQIFPALTFLITKLASGVAAVVALEKRTGLLRSVLIALGLVLGKLAVAKFAGQLLTLGRAAIVPLLKFALLVLVVDDLIALFEGRGSVIGTFIDKIFGKGTSEALVKGINDIIDAIEKGDFEGSVQKASDGLDKLGAKISKTAEKTPGLSFALFGLIGGFAEFAPAIESAVQAIAKGAGDIVLAFDDLTARARRVLADFVAEAFQVGTDFVAGLAEGILSGASVLTGALGTVLKGAVATGKDAIDSSSPAQVPADEIGKPFVEGIAMGALRAAQKASRVVAAATSVATAPAAVAAAPGGGTAGLRGGGVVFQSDIRITVEGGSASDPQIQKLRQGVRSNLQDNRRATLAALVQRGVK